MPDEWPITELFNQDYLHFSARRVTEQASDADVETIWRVGIDFPLPRGRPSVMAAVGHAANSLIWGVLAIGVTIGLVVRVLHRMRD
jgi:hypothetical protein